MEVLKNESDYPIIKSIEGKQGYFADSEGNIYTLWTNKGYHGLVMQARFKKLKFSKSKSGHLVVSFGRKEKELVHRVIYRTFVGEIPDGYVVRHLNDIPSDNRVVNLTAGTQKENMMDAGKNGRFKTKLNPEQVIKIKSLKGFKKRKEVAEEFSVSEGTVKDIWNNRTWEWIK